MAAALELQLAAAVPAVSDVFHKLLQKDVPPSFTLPFLPVHLATLKVAWEHPAISVSVSKRDEAMYKVQPTDAPFLH